VTTFADAVEEAATLMCWLECMPGHPQRSETETDVALLQISHPDVCDAARAKVTSDELVAELRLLREQPELCGQCAGAGFCQCYGHQVYCGCPAGELRMLR